MRYTYRQVRTTVSHLTLAIYATRILAAWLKYGRTRFSRKYGFIACWCWCFGVGNHSNSWSRASWTFESLRESRSTEFRVGSASFWPFQDLFDFAARRERQATSDTVQDRKKACEFKSRGNRKQFEFNASVDAILTDIASKAYSPDEVKSLANDGKEKIRKRRKLVKLAHRNKDGWLVVQEYESDDLASNSKDEKKIKKAKTAAEKRRKDATPHGSSCNPFKKSKISGDNQLFRGKTFPKCLCRARPLPKILC